MNYSCEHFEVVVAAMPKPAGSEICLSGEVEENFLVPTVPHYSPGRYETQSVHESFEKYSDIKGNAMSDSVSIRSDNPGDETIPDGVKNYEIQDPTLTQKSQLVDESDEAISNMSRIVRQTEPIVEDEDVMPNLASSESNPMISQRTPQANSKNMLEVFSSNKRLAPTQSSQCQTSPSREKLQASAKDDKIDDS